MNFSDEEIAQNNYIRKQEIKRDSRLKKLKKCMDWWIDLLIKHRNNKEDFSDAIMKYYEEDKLKNPPVDIIDAEEELSKIMQHELDKYIIIDLFWIGKDDTIKPHLRRMKLSRILGNDS